MEASDHKRSLEQYAHAFQQGDEQALAFFYREFYPSLAHYANRWTENRPIAEEIASGAFIKAWRMHWKLDSYGGIRAYLYKIVLRDSQDTLKRERKRRATHRDSKPLKISHDTPFDQLIRSEVYRQVHTALKDLSPANRRVLTMYYLEGKTTGQIAAELKLHPSTIKTQKTKGLEILRKKLLRPTLVLLFILVKTFFPFS